MKSLNLCKPICHHVQLSQFEQMQSQLQELELLHNRLNFYLREVLDALRVKSCNILEVATRMEDVTSILPKLLTAPRATMQDQATTEEQY